MLNYHIHFLRPWWLLAIIPFALLWWQLAKLRLDTASNWAQVIDPKLLPHLFHPKIAQQKSRGKWLLGLVWLIALIAMAGPSWQQRQVPVSKHGAASVMVLDLSPTIQATDLPPTRLTRARYKLRDLLAIPEGEMALVVYAGEAHTVAPITEDHQTIAAFLNDLSPNIMPVGGSDIAAALQKAQKLLLQNNSPSGDIILLSSANRVPEQAIETARALHAKGLTITVLGIGTAHGGPIQLDDGTFFKDAQGTIFISKLDTVGLEKLANAGGGNYIPFTSTTADVDEIKQQLLRKHYQTKQQDSQNQHISRWVDQGYVLVWLLLPLVLIGFRRGYRERYLG